MNNLLQNGHQTSTLLLSILGIVAGTLSGILGIGGAIIIIPTMVLMFGISQHVAQGTTLAMMLPPVTLLSVLHYHKAGNIDWRISTIICISFFFGGIFGAKLANMMDPLLLRKTFGIVMLIISLKMIFSN